MLKQFYISTLNFIIFVVLIIGLCLSSLSWANFKKIYQVGEINIYGTNFFDR